MTTGSAGRPIRICMVGPTAADYPGGMAVQIARLAEELNKREDTRAEIVSFAPRLGGLAGRLQRVPLIRTALTTSAYLRELNETLASADVVHVHSAGATSFAISSLPGVQAARRRQLPVVLHYHSGLAARDLARWGRPLVAGLRQANTLVVPSRYLAEIFGAVGITAEVIPNFPDLARITHRLRDPVTPVFLSCRHFETIYDIPTILRAFATIQAEIPGATLLLAGRGAQREALERLAAGLGLQGVSFLGQVEPERMPEVYDRAGVLLNASTTDNMPMSIIEAYAAGLPVVSTAAGGIPHIAEDGRTAFLVPVGDDAALATAALRLVTEPGLGSRIGMAARRYCEEAFAPAGIVDRWVALYRRLRTAGVVRREDAP